MKHSRRLVALVALLLLCAHVFAQSTIIRGKVVAVTDGDTITVLDADNQKHKIRLQGIDAPETAQPFGDAAKEFLSALALDKEVTASCSKIDRYGRLVCKVVKPDGTDICQAMLWNGVAWHYKFYQNEQTESDRNQYAHAEGFARERKLGLWADAAALAPWDYRHAEKKESEEIAEPAAAQTANGSIIGNRSSGIYHWQGCPNYNDIAAVNQVIFGSREEAERAGYRAAKNCPAQATTPATNSASAPTSTGGTVNVKGYYRKDGTYVRPHTRRAPRKKN